MLINIRHAVASFLLLAAVTSADESETIKDTSTTVAIDTTTVDTNLTTAPEVLSAEERLKEFKESKKYHRPFSFFDTVSAYYLSARTNLRGQLDRSFYHDAGDYFKSDPSMLLLKMQATPMRETVQPYGLNLGRLNYIAYGQQYRPFEHMPLPDGLTDLNDFPTALDDEVQIIDGPAGQLFGGEDAIASIVTRPVEPSDQGPATAILADAGSFGYSYTRGRYSNRFDSGKQIEMSVGYRDADGNTLNRRDDSYQYYGNMLFPVSSQVAVHAVGRLYNRDGFIGVWQDGTGRRIARERFDRDLRAGVQFGNDKGSRRSEIGYNHARNGSYTYGSYSTRYNLTTHGGYYIREWLAGGAAWQTELSGESREYDYGSGQDERESAVISLRRAGLGGTTRFAQTLSGRWVESFGFLPSAALQFFREDESSLFTLSAGYTERAPSQDELYSPERTSPTLLIDSYLDRGNDSLSKERQLIGSLNYELGRRPMSLRLSMTSGRIYNAIIWDFARPGEKSSSYEFYPINSDVEFSDFSAETTIQPFGFLYLNGGGAYHLVAYEHQFSPPYTPEFEMYASGEIHLFWKQKLLHFYAFGELQFLGPYIGYSGLPMGEEPIINTKLSIRIKNFRFSYHFQNVIGNQYQEREFMYYPGRYTFYNVTWNFFN